MDEFRNKRRNDQAAYKDNTTDNMINPPVGIEKRAQSIIVILRDRPVHTEYHRGADPQLGQIQDMQQGCEHASQTEEFHSQIV